MFVVSNSNCCMSLVFTDECLAAQCFSFLVAGSDPVANACSFCLYALADNIRIQETLQREVDAVLQKHDGKWTYETVKEMTYLDQVISGGFYQQNTNSWILMDVSNSYIEL